MPDLARSAVPADMTVQPSVQLAESRTIRTWALRLMASERAKVRSEYRSLAAERTRWLAMRSRMAGAPTPSSIATIAMATTSSRAVKPRTAICLQTEID